MAALLVMKTSSDHNSQQCIPVEESISQVNLLQLSNQQKSSLNQKNGRLCYSTSLGSKRVVQVPPRMELLVLLKISQVPSQHQANVIQTRQQLVVHVDLSLVPLLLV